MNYLKMFVLTSALSVSALADQSVIPGLTAVEREPCLMLPALKPLATAISGADYEVTADYHCIDGVSQCFQRLSLDLKYRYMTVIRTDYYTPDGKLATSKDNKSVETITSYGNADQHGKWRELPGNAGYVAVDDAAKAVLADVYQQASEEALIEIQEKVSEAADICSGSFYK